MNIESDREREYAERFTAKYEVQMHREFRQGLEGVGLKVLHRHDILSPAGTWCNTYLVEGTGGVRFLVSFRGAFRAVLAVDAKAKTMRVDLGLEAEKYAEEKIAGLVEPLMKLLPAALETLEPSPGRSSMRLLDGALEVTLYESLESNGKQ